jgi:hypothetical protein
MSPSIVVLVLAQGIAAASCGSRGSAATTAPSAIVGLPVTGAVQVRGSVYDTAYRALAGARVEVVDGPQAGLSTTADSRGEFSLAGTFDDTTRFRATKDGYVSATRTRSPYSWVTFELGVVAPPIDIAGDYTMTFVADGSCVALPDEFRTRAYTTTIPAAANASPANASFGITVRGALKGWDIQGMGVSGDYVAVWLETLVEQIAPNTFLSFGGLAAASIGTSGGSAITLRFDGMIDYCTTKTASGRYEDCYTGAAAGHLQCQSTNHQLIFTRR